MLTQLTDSKYFDQLIQLARKFPEGGAYNLSRELHLAIANPLKFLILADVEDEKVRGFVFLAAAIWNGERVAFVRGYAGKISRPIRREGLEAIGTWCKERSTTAILGFTQRPQGFVRRYGFQVISAVIRKEVKTNVI